MLTKNRLSQLAPWIAKEIEEGNTLTMTQDTPFHRVCDIGDAVSRGILRWAGAKELKSRNPNSESAWINFYQVVQ